MTRRKHTVSRLLLLALLAISLCMPGFGLAEGADGHADMYFENGVVYTVDAQDSVAEALAVRDGKIVFVGTAADGAAYRAGAAEVVDLAGGMLLPGMIDSHIHTIAPDFFDINLTEIADLDASIQAIRDYVEANPDQASYSGFGYYASLFEGEELLKGPRKERLDEISPDKPLYIMGFDGHSIWMNSRCFEANGITVDTVAPVGGQIPKDDETGELWGTVMDSAMALMPHLMDKPAEELLPALADFNSALNGLGFTSIMALPGNGFAPIPWESFVRLEQAGELTLRVRSAGVVTGWNIEEDMADLAALQAAYGDGDGLIKMTTAKIFADGVVDNESAYLLEPYTSDPGNRGFSDWEAQDLSEAVAAINAMGVQAHVHAIGDAAARMALDAFAYARENGPAGDYRNAITHLQLVSPEDIPRFAELDAIAVVQPYWHVKDANYWEAVEYAQLGERAEHEYPMRSFLEHGVRLAIASDYPVTFLPNPFVGIESAVTRNVSDPALLGIQEDITDMDDPAQLLWPQERITVREAIRASTIDGAYAMFEEDVTGSLEVGKSADMIIIDRNILEINPVDISGTQVLRTYLQGVLVYSAQ